MSAQTREIDQPWRRPPVTWPQQRADIAVGLVLAVAAVVSFELARSVGLELDRSPGRVEQTLWALAVTLPLCLRRRFPVAVLLLVSSAFIGLQARLVLEGFVSSIALFLAVFTVGAWVGDRRLATAARTVVVVAMFAWLGISLSTTAWSEALTDKEPTTGLLPPVTATLVFVFLSNLVYFGAAWVFGDRAWRHARDRAELVTRNAELATERHENARRAVIEERVRIARELHDVVAHHVSVMGVQAGAARHVLASRPEAARDALAAIEVSSRTAVDEMRKLLGVLRQGGDVGAPPQFGDLPDGPAPAGTTGAGGAAPGETPGSRAPLPGVRDLPDLVARLDHPASLTATFTVIGQSRPLPTAVSVSVYRVAQEALTNTVKHARARRVDVRLRWLESDVEIEVVDDGRGSTASSPTPSSGMGLVGMRERVALHRGELEAGPRAVGGYRVRARFPAPPGEPAAADTPGPEVARTGPA